MDKKIERPLTHEERQALIHLPITLQIIGRRAWAGFSLEADRDRQHHLPHAGISEDSSSGYEDDTTDW